MVPPLKTISEGNASRPNGAAEGNVSRPIGAVDGNVSRLIGAKLGRASSGQMENDVTPSSSSLS